MSLLTDQRQRAGAFFASQPFYWREAALCAPAIPLLLLTGVVMRQVAFAAIASGAALLVGFGAARDLGGRRWGAMIAVMVGTTLAAFVGVLAGQWLPVMMVLAAAASMACAVLALYDEDLWWISLQIVVALLIANYYPGPPLAAFQRAAAVLTGGVVQLVTVILLARVWPSAAQRLPPAPLRAPPTRTLLIGHALRAAVCVVGALTLAHLLGLVRGYWAPMTAMIVLKPGLTETHTRGMARLVGTLIGCAAASLFAMACGYAWPWMVLGIAAAASASFALQKAHYAILSGAITATVVLILSLVVSGGAVLNAEHRLIATVIGGGLALIVARIAPHRPLTDSTGPDRVGGGA